MLSTWAVHLPALQTATGISTSTLGTILLILGAGAIAGMRLSARLADRFGPRWVAVLSMGAMALLIVPPLIATNWVWAAAGAFVLGLATGSGEVAMNAAAVVTERLYERPLLASFHGAFSASTVVGSLISAAAFSLHASTLTTVLIASGVCLAVVTLAAAALRRCDPALDVPAAAPADPPDTGTDGAAPVSRGRVAVLCLLAFLFLFAEGSAMDWSSMHAQRQLGETPAAGAIAFGSFVGAMTIGRFCIDRLSARYGPVVIVRFGAAVAIVGLVVVVLSTALPLTLVGWALTGLGVAGGVPQVISAAGNLGDGSARRLSLVVGVGYLAILAGPGVIGWVADLTSLSTAFALPIAAVVVCALAAPAVRR